MTPRKEFDEDGQVSPMWETRNAYILTGKPENRGVDGRIRLKRIFK
jgi:hypothetical protein